MSQESPAPLLFADLGLSDAVMKAVATVGYETPSPIQAATIPAMLEGRDVLGQAQTGTAVAAGDRTVGLREGLEQAGQLHLVHADAAVSDAEMQFDPGLVARLERDVDEQVSISWDSRPVC